MPSLLEALERKYSSSDIHAVLNNDNDDSAETHEHERLISIFTPRLPPLLSVPELLVLNDCDIDRAGEFNELGDKCKRVRELDLAQNKLCDWNEVLQIVKHMPRIEFFNLSRNQLNSSLCKGCMSPITNLRGIVLNGTYLNWDSIEILLENLPLLEELHLSLNDFKEVLIDTNPDESYDLNVLSNENEIYCKCKIILPHKALKILHFTGNPIDKWIEICRLGRIFPNMEKLVLAKCPIKTLPDNDITYKNFPSLLFLNLSCARLDTWDDVDRLSRFPKLNDLRVKNWPLWKRLECTEHERRQLLIARLPNVKILNGGGIIGTDEREVAERAFIRYYMEKPDNEKPKRYHELICIHGKINPLVNISLKPDKRVKISLTYGDKTESRFVDIYRTVWDLKVKLEKIVHITPNKMRLFYVDQVYKEFGPEEMRFPNKFLYSYNIRTGDEIIVDKKK